MCPCVEAEGPDRIKGLLPRSCSQTLLVCKDTEEEGQSDRKTDFIETDVMLEWRREQQGDGRETLTVTNCTDTGAFVHFHESHLQFNTPVFP